MKKAILLVLLLCSFGTLECVRGDATIIFSQRNIRIASGAPFGGGNGNGTYDVPIWQMGMKGQYGTGGAGLLPGGVTIGLFLPGVASPLLNAATGLPATTLLRSDSINNHLFTTLSQTVIVPGAIPGTTANLEVKAWQGPNSFEDLYTGKAPGQWTVWAFTSQPLGGVPPGGGLPIVPPGMTGWGPENGTGLALDVWIPEPEIISLAALGIGTLFLRRFFLRYA